MRLYIVEEHEYNSRYFYWAENEQDALTKHLAQGHDPDLDWEADRVWADNYDTKLRGFVVREDN